MAKTKTLRGNVTIWAAKVEAFTTSEWADLDGLSAAKFATNITAGLIVDISCAVEDGYILNATGDTTNSSQSICDITEVETPLFKEYAASLDIYRNTPGTSDTPIYNIALSWFDEVDVPLYLIKRVDETQGIPVEAGHILSVFKVTNDYGQDLVDDNDLLMYGARFKTPGGINTNKSAQA